MKSLFTITAAAALALSGLPALAGDGTYSRDDGHALSIACKSSGCVVKAKPPGGTWGTVEKTAGGKRNFKKLDKKYKAQGFKKQ